MDHVGTAAPAVRRPSFIGPQRICFGLSSRAEQLRERNGGLLRSTVQRNRQLRLMITE